MVKIKFLTNFSLYRFSLFILISIGFKLNKSIFHICLRNFSYFWKWLKTLLILETLNPEKWVDNYADYLYNYTIVRVNDPILTQDIVAETFLAGLKAKENFKGEASERTWLISILKRKIIDFYRRSNSEKGKAEINMSFQNPDSEGDWLEENAADPFDRTAENLIENEELRLAILECMSALPDRQAEIFTMKTIDGVETDVIC